jgi:hypothetical protein
MSAVGRLDQGSQVGRPGLRITLLVAAVTLLAALTMGAQRAHADEAIAHFCPTSGSWVWLDPAWTGTYRCDGDDSVSGYGRFKVELDTFERAGCLDYADVWHNLITSWACFPKETWYSSLSIRQDGGWYRGVIRNNNSTYRARFGGRIWRWV